MRALSSKGSKIAVVASEEARVCRVRIGRTSYGALRCLATGAELTEEAEVPPSMLEEELFGGVLESVEELDLTARTVDRRLAMRKLDRR